MASAQSRTALALEPQPRVPIRAALVDHWLVEDGDLLVAVLPLLSAKYPRTLPGFQ